MRGKLESYNFYMCQYSCTCMRTPKKKIGIRPRPAARGSLGKGMEAGDLSNNTI